MTFSASFLNSSAIPFSIPFPKASKTTNMNIPEDTESPVRKVRSLFLRMVSNISCQRSKSNICSSFSSYLFYSVVIDNHAVFKVDDSLGHVGYIFFVGNDKNGFAFIVNALNELHNLIRSFGIKGTCGFIGQEYFGVRSQSSGNGNPLFLPS